MTEHSEFLALLDVTKPLDGERCPTLDEYSAALAIIRTRDTESAQKPFAPQTAPYRQSIQPTSDIADPVARPSEPVIVRSFNVHSESQKAGVTAGVVTGYGVWCDSPRVLASRDALAGTTTENIPVVIGEGGYTLVDAKGQRFRVRQPKK